MEPLNQPDPLQEEVEAPDIVSEKMIECQKIEEHIQEKSNKFGTQIYINLYLNIEKLNRKVQPSWNLLFIVNKSKDCQLLKQLSRFVMPPESKASFYNKSLAGCRMKEFLSKSIPTRIQQINVSMNNYEKSPRFFNLILRASMLTTASIKLICFKNLKIKQLKRVFSAAKHTKSLGISFSTLCLPACLDFSDCFRGTTLSQLKLHYIKVKNRDKTDRNLHELDGLISGLSKSSDLHKSIQSIDILAYNTFGKEDNELLTKYGFPVE
ncbi:unnamed protein product [Moneuplotes crassus]|uniref:Uncharacterized protein n=1 Tax=Euplotes crassus TaxID=5936 RepID=A0AAD1XAG2_EUPCR|nr:unnamed protein product [Moneuplotes crassus]